jgi:quercetin 2,3-dioxygenase
MLEVRRAKDRGHFNHGWLDTSHTFSFADYYDPKQMGFRTLRVINEDRVAPGKGFGTHGHRSMEIVTYVLEGALEHKDSMGNGSVIRPGEVQIMGAGSGVTHSEYNGSKTEPVHFYQIWILPRAQGGEPRYGQRAFSREERTGALRLLVSPDGADGSLAVKTDARIFGTLLGKGESLVHGLLDGRSAWVQVARGSVDVNGTRLDAGDGIALSDEAGIALTGIENAELLVFDLP